MSKRILWLRISYWTGAVVDGLAALQMLVPTLFAATYGVPDFRPDAAYAYAAGTGASLMLGWTVLLIWADRKPVERKGVLVITMFPVVVGLIANETWAVGSNFLSLGAVMPAWIVQVGLIALFAFSYLNARGVESERRS